jgi:inorganic pyrophosphatase
MEMNKKIEFNPITQDKVKSGPKAGENRFYAHAIPWNYGFIPQTYEDPKRIDERTNCKGVCVCVCVCVCVLVCVCVCVCVCYGL